MAGLTWGTFNVGLVIFFSFTPTLLMTRGLSTADASSVVSLGLWVSILSVPLGGYLTERVGLHQATVLHALSRKRVLTSAGLTQLPDFTARMLPVPVPSGSSGDQIA